MNSEIIPFLSEKSIASFKFNTHQTLLGLVANTSTFGIAFSKIHDAFSVNDLTGAVTQCQVSYEMTAHMRTFIVAFRKAFYLHTETNTPIEKVFVSIRSYDYYQETEVAIDSEISLTFGVLRILVDLKLTDKEVLGAFL